MKKLSILTKCLATTLCIIYMLQQSFSQLSVSITGPSTLSPGQSALLTASASGGAPPYTYLWQGSYPGSSYTANGPYVYTVQVTDNNNATAIARDTVLNSDTLGWTFNVRDEVCANYCSGFITVRISGMTGGYARLNSQPPPYTYTGNDGTIYMEDICAGNYLLTASDLVGNEFSQNVTIAPSPNPPFHTWITASPDTIAPKQKSTITIHYQGGAPPYTAFVNGYTWSTYDSTISYYGLLPGNYSIGSVSDAYPGCVNPVGANIPAKVYGYSGPVAFDDYLQQGLESTMDIGVLNNDKNVSYWGNTIDAHQIFLTGIVSQPIHGTAGVVNGNPSYVRYMHDASGIWVDSFTYRICDTATIPNCDTGTVYINTTCYYSCIWPGDANHDDIVDNNDLLAIGLGYNVMGNIRQLQGNIFMATTSYPWVDSLPDGTNLKHVDCNGDGTINVNDTVAILQNFGYYTVRSMGDNEWRSNIPTLQPVTEQDSLKHGDTLTIDLYLGDGNTPVTDAYGIAFTINYDPLTVDTTQTKVVFGDSWLGNATDKISISKDLKAIGQIKCALTRIDHNNRSGQGPIGQVSYVITTDNINGKDLSYYQNIISLSDITLISNDGEEIPVNAGRDTSIIEYEITGINETAWGDKINLYPNPANNVVIINSPQLNINSISMVNVLGEVVVTIPINGHKATINSTSLRPGIYFTELHTDKGTFTKRLMITR